MPRTAKAPAAEPRAPMVEVETDEGIVVDPDDSEILAAPLSDLMAVMQGEPEAKVVVHKIEKENGVRKNVFILDCPPHDELQNELQAEHGPGSYRVAGYARTTDSLGRRMLLLRFNKTVHIGATPESKRAAAIVNATPAVAQPDRIAEVLAQIAASSAQRETQLFGLVQAMITGGGNSAEKQLSGLKTLAESIGIVGKSAVAAPGPLDMLAMLSQMMKMAKDFAPATDALPRGEDGDLGPNALLAQGMQMFAKILELAKTGPQGAPQLPQPRPGDLSFPTINQQMNPAPAQPRPVAAPSAPAPGNGASALHAEPSEEDEDAMMMQLFMRKLIKAARANEPVDGYAEQLEPLISDEAEAVIRSEEWFAALCSMSQDASAYQPWFARLRDALLKLLDDESAGSVDDLPESLEPKPGALPN